MAADLPRRRRRPWTQVETELLRRNYADSLTTDLAKVLDRDPRHVLAKANGMGLLKSRGFIAEVARERSARPDHGSHKSRFEKGHVPANKGLRRPGWSAGEMERTQFKKGNRPCTWVPVGSYRVNSDGYADIKLCETPGPSNLRWKPVHRHVWEQVNGPVPDGHAVVFKPGRQTTDPTLITLDAVELVSRRELLARNSIHNLPQQLIEVIQLRGALNRQINKRSAKE